MREEEKRRKDEMINKYMKLVLLISPSHSTAVSPPSVSSVSFNR